MDTISTRMKEIIMQQQEEEEEEEEKLHIAMFPWLAFGHIFPFLELAKLIAEKGHKVSFISTPRNIDRLPKLPQNLSQLITTVKLPLPSVQGLPSNAEATSDLPLDKGRFLKKAFDLLRDPMALLLETLKPDWLLMDFAPFWLPEIARIGGVRSAFLSIFPAFSLGFIGSEKEDYRRKAEDFTVAPRWLTFPSSVAYRYFEAKRVIGEFRGGDEIEQDVAVMARFSAVQRGCDVVAVRSCWELEKDHLTLLADRLRKPVVPVGQIPPALHNDAGESGAWTTIERWLDMQEKSSVVYVAFGSEAEWSEAELRAIALGLEMSGLAFFWALRARPGAEARLPEGFEERVKGRGLVCRSWVPQVRILGHEAIGAFLSHSGWSSVVEALELSRPLVLLAFFNDQGLNLKFLEEKGIGYPVPRDEYDGSFTAEAVAESLRMVVHGEDGRVYRDKAKQVSAFFGDRALQHKYVHDFLTLLMTYNASNAQNDASVG